MTGSDKARFCSHCALEVNNISALTRKQAMRLVREADGRICVRYVKDPVDDSPVFAGGKLYRITRRAGIAAGVLGATLSLSTLAYAQGEPVLNKARTEISQKETTDKDKSESGAASLSGTVTDPNGAVIPRTKITLTSLKTGENLTTESNEEGFYKFENIESGKYGLLFKYEKYDGFKPFSMEIEAVSGKENVANASLELSEITVTLGELAVVEYSSPLFAAVSGGDLEQVKNLVARGENVNYKDENYSRITPLFVAVENGSAEIAETLLNFGAKINAKDDHKQTPLMRLDEDASVELVDLLIKHGARVNLTDKEGSTALILAARSVKAEVLQILIRHSADLDARNRIGRTALMEAADADNLEAVRALLLAGADVNLKDEDGETAFDLTTDEEIENLLESYGADIKDDSQ